MLAAFALTVSVSAAPIPLELEVNQWFRRGDHTVIPGASLVGLRGAAGFADGLLTVGDVDGDGRPEILVGGGRAGENTETGAAFLVGLAGDRQMVVERVFDGPPRKAGFGRYLFRGPGPDGAEVIGMGRLARRRMGWIDVWNPPRDQGEWRKLGGPGETDLDDLAAACLPGDVDGDGVPDLLVACTRPDEQTVLKLFRGGASGFERRPARNWKVGTAVDREAELLPVGDLNQDGRADWILARPGSTNLPAGGGTLDLFLGGAPVGGLEPVAHWAGGRTGDHLGSAMVLADLDGDGHRDLVVGAPGFEHLDGRVLVFSGRKGGWEVRASAVLAGGQAGDLFGSTLAVGTFAGRKGRVDLAIGAPGWHGTHLEEGAVHLVPGEVVRTGSVAEVASGVYVGSQTRAEVGRMLANGGDLDGDGWEELVMGLPRMGHSPNKAGRLEILWGGSGSGRGAGGAPWTNILSYPKDPFVVAVERRLAEAAAARPPEIPDDARVAARPAGEGQAWLPWAWVGSVLAALGTGCGLCLWRRRILNGERLRIARDLHDELGGHLVRLQEPESGQAGAVSNAARQVAAGIERTIWSIHPGRRTLPDLACGLTDLAENLLGDTSVRRRFDLPLDLPRVEVRVEVLDVVYRVVQEALTNVRKHSQATQVRLEMGLESGAFEVRVVDDGVGMLSGTGQGRDRAGLGLESMMTRVRGVGGSLSIEASQPRGVTVRVRVPTG